MNIPFHKPFLDDDDIQAVVETLKSGWITTGPAVRRFEAAFAEYTGAKHAIAVNSCTAAMHLALAGLGVGPGDAVITSPYTFVATAEAIQYLGARPVFVDVREEDFNIDPEKVLEVLRAWEVGRERAGGGEWSVGRGASSKGTTRKGAGRSFATPDSQFLIPNSPNSDTRSLIPDAQQGRLRAILPVHIAGHPCNMAALMAIAREYGLKVVEDAAHCLEGAVFEPGSQGAGELGSRGAEEQGSTGERERRHHGLQQRGSGGEREHELASATLEAPPLGGALRDAWAPRDEGTPSPVHTAAPARKKIGTIGDATCFSFYATKNITTGEGGMVTTEDDELAERIRILSLHGMSRDAWKRYTAEGTWVYEIVAQGYKYNMPDILAALGLAQLRKAEKMYALRKRYAMMLLRELEDLEEIILPHEPPNVLHAWHLFIIRLRLEKLKITRNEFIHRLRQRGVHTSVHFIPLHLHPYYQRTYGTRRGDFPVAEKLYESAVSLPFYPAMTEEEVGYVAECVREAVVDG